MEQELTLRRAQIERLLNCFEDNVQFLKLKKLRLWKTICQNRSV